MDKQIEDKTIGDLIGADFIAAKERAVAFLNLYAAFNKLGKKSHLQDQLLDAAEKEMEPFLSKLVRPTTILK